MKEPVCLGLCEHMLCRSCAGPRAGDGCVVCHSPAWVKDIQINRQLSSIIELFCGLESLLTPIKNPDSSVAEIQPDGPVPKNNKKNFKIWFSPRSRKVRCTVEKAAEITVLDNRSPGETSAAQQDTLTAQCQDLSKRSTKKNATSRNTKQNLKKKRLEAINQQWGISEEAHLSENEQVCADGARRSSKRVSFLSPVVTSDGPQPEMAQRSTDKLSPARSTVRESLSQGSETVLNCQTELVQPLPESAFQHDQLSADVPKPNDNPKNHKNVSPSEHSSKRSRTKDRNSTLDNTPKRPRPSPGRRGRKSLSPISPVVLNPPSLTTPKSTKKSRKEGRDSPSVQASPSTESYRRSSCFNGASVGRSSPGSPAVMKRNHKGETLLHLAAIKGDVEAVKDLLDQGADPNLKDNAGWTPLHEACNLGHLAVVELLVSMGALLNTPGYENDSPLHDAVRNGHSSIVKLLLQLGASQNVFPRIKRHTDCILSDTLVQNYQNLCHRQNVDLYGLVCVCFLFPVSHIVVPEGQMPTTYSTLMGLLAGCWIAVFKVFTNVCSRRISQLPPLFDGCFFFLLGSFKTPTKDELTKLLREGGAQLLNRQPKPDSDVTQTVNATAYHALPGSDQALCTHYIIYDPQAPHKPSVVRRGKVWSAPTTWVINCITAFSLLPVPDPELLV
uniref:BRCA1 associated RING domain 1 n=1 Tax=Maylandia zebra TaxID=106582 RepID=A0A3P9BTS8_9CICH